MQNIKIPIIDITRYLTCGVGWEADCKEVAEALKIYGLLVIKDPRVNAQQNSVFLDLMEQYFVRRSQQYREGHRDIDFCPESNFQLGIMHEFQQMFQSYKQQKQKLSPPNHSLTPITADRDPKWRYHWKVNYPKNVIPNDFQKFKDIMNNWGYNMRNGCLTVAEMAAIGLGLQKDYFTKTIQNGDFMLSPTAVDLQRSKQGDVLAAFHRDFDLLTIHGKARYSGLFAWLNTGQKFLVKVPQGHLLLQAGKQMEWLTGGIISAGFHEVVYTQDVEKGKVQALKQNRIPWRISSTMFCQVQDSYVLKPHDKFSTGESLLKYPPITAGEYLNQQLHYLTGLK